MNTQRIVGPFDPQLTAAEVIREIDLAGKRAIVMGASCVLNQ